MNVILLTGRGGSKSIPGKNVYPILGRPLTYLPHERCPPSQIHRCRFRQHRRPGHQVRRRGVGSAGNPPP